MLIKIRTLFTCLCLAIFISACGDSTSSTDNNGDSIIPSGPTDFVGVWEISAIINIGAAGSISTTEQTSSVLVSGNGASAIQSTNATGALTINFNGNSLGYQTTLLVSNGGETPTACPVTITGTARIAGSASNGAASGSFPTKTIVCNQAAITITGNITGSNTGDTDE